MKQELTVLLRTADWRVSWTQAGAAQVDSGELVMLDLKGTCNGEAQASIQSSRPALASTAVSDGRVLPFSWVNCEAVNQMLAPALQRRGMLERQRLIGRSLARIVAHELYHVLANEKDHSDHGVSKTCFTLKDLLSDTFAFEPEALAKMRPAVDTLATVPAYAPARGGAADIIDESADSGR